MPIARRALVDDEEVLIDLRLHWVFLIGPMVVTAVALGVSIAVVVEFQNAPVAVAWVLAVIVAVPLLWTVGRIVRWLGISLVVTTTRIVYRQGVLGRNVTQVRLQRVTEVHCSQRLLERLIGSGRLVVGLAGDDSVIVDDVRRPRTLQRVITRQLDQLSAPVPPEGVEVPGSTPIPSSDALFDTPPHGSLAVQIAATSPPRDAEAATSVPEQLIQLDDLRRRGILSEGEFEAKKAELLDRM